MADAPGTHTPVLLAEVLDALAIKPGGIYVDATFGRGGHARGILARLGSAGRLIALDRDADAERSAQTIDDPRFAFRRGWFSEFADALAALGVDRIDGFLLDLGVSSPQIDDPARGFSFRAGVALDMRMDAAEPMTAADWLNETDEAELARVFKEAGDEPKARRLAREIVHRRARTPIRRAARHDDRRVLDRLRERSHPPRGRARVASIAVEVHLTYSEPD